MENQFKKLRYNNKRINAITPDNLQDVLEDKPPFFCGNEACLFSNCYSCKFEYSCSCSHLKAIQEGFKNGDKYFIVCEDDIYIPFNVDIKKIINDLPEDFDIFQMIVLDEGACSMLYNHFETTNDFYVKFKPFNNFFSTGMYLITHEGAGKILDNTINKKSLKYDLTNIKIYRQADFLIYSMVNTYTTTFPLCIPNISLISEIHPNHFNLQKNSIIKMLEILNNVNKCKYIIKKEDIKYYWINLDKANIRREFMEKQFITNNINNERISAKTPDDLKEILEDQPPFFCGYKECIDNKCKNCPYEYATICSHLEAIKRGFMSGNEYFIVCEDDIILKFNINFDNIINYLPKDFDILQMMVISKSHLDFLYNKCFIENIIFTKYVPITPSAAFYLISHTAAGNILKKFTNIHTNKWDFSNFKNLKVADVLIYESVNTYVSTFPLCSFNINFKSQIHDFHFNDHNEAYEMITEIHKNYNLYPFILNILS